MLRCGPMPRPALAHWLRSPALRTALLLCVPALVVGAWVRIDLLLAVPEAWFNTDVRQVIGQAHRFLEEGRFEIPNRRTFLSGLQFAIPISQGWAATVFAAWTQHLLGLAFIVTMGLATIAWTRHWRAWIVPVTLVAALHPILLWYEHFALPDSMQTIFLVMASVAGYAFFRRPGAGTFALLLGAVFLTAGARQEGRYFCAFVLAAVVAVHWGRPRVLAAYLAVALVFSGFTFHVTRTTQSGQMLLTATIHLLPDDLPGYGDLPSRLVPHRERSLEAWDGRPRKHNGRRKAIRKTLKAWLMESEGLRSSVANHRADPLSKELATRIALRQPHHVPQLALAKFLSGFDDEAYPGFGASYFPEEFVQDIVRDIWHKERSPALFGRTFASQDELAAYALERYQPLPPDWIGNRASRLADAVRGVRLPGFDVGMYHMAGAPLVWALAGVGLVGVAVRSRNPFGFETLWLLNLVAVAVAMFAGAPVRTRYRLMFLPWVILGLAMFADLAVAAAHTLRSRTRSA